jgi:hypothetical protein
VRYRWGRAADDRKVAALGLPAAKRSRALTSSALRPTTCQFRSVPPAGPRPPPRLAGQRRPGQIREHVVGVVVARFDELGLLKAEPVSAGAGLMHSDRLLARPRVPEKASLGLLLRPLARVTHARWRPEQIGRVVFAPVLGDLSTGQAIDFNGSDCQGPVARGHTKEFPLMRAGVGKSHSDLVP